MIKIKLNDVGIRESGHVDKGKMSPRDEHQYIRYLLDGGIDQIEIGYPGSSKEQLSRCQEIIAFVDKQKSKNRPLLSGLATSSEKMIDAVKNAGCNVCHIYIQASDNFISAMFKDKKYGITKEEKQDWVIKRAVEMVTYAKKLGFKRIQYSPEDAGRSEKEFLCRLIEAVIKSGVDVVNIPDTTGLNILNEFGDLISYIKKNVSNIDQAEISVHIHNDSDHATSNALQAIIAGATIIEGNFYGRGERSGMTKFEAILMAVNTRRDIFKDYFIDFNTSYCREIVNFTANALGMPVPRHWVVVGEQNGTCTSGTHQAIEERAKDKEQGYYSWYPEKYGHEKVMTVITSSSGKGGIKQKLNEMGYIVNEEELEKICVQSKSISDAKGGDAIEDRELTAIVHDVLAEIPFPIKIVKSYAVGGTLVPSKAIITGKSFGKLSKKIGRGNGIFDSVLNAVWKVAMELYPEYLNGVEIELDGWSPIAVTEGSESLADTYSSIRFTNGDNGTFSGKALHYDTVQACAQSFANCFSWYIQFINNSKNLVIHHEK